MVSKTTSSYHSRSSIKQMASKVELRKSLEQYEAALVEKSDKLPDLDGWYRNELQSTVQSRNASKGGAYLTTTELVKLMKWKLTRGKFRPRLEQLAGSNPDEMVQSTTKEAFALLKASTSIDSAKQSLLKLNSLKGIGPATSSAILSLFSPDALPFMSDEALKFAAGLKEKPKYSVKEWEWFVAEMRQRMEKEDWNGVGELEKAAWSFAVLKSSTNGSEKVNTKRAADEELNPSAKRKRK